MNLLLRIILKPCPWLMPLFTLHRAVSIMKKMLLSVLLSTLYLTTRYLSMHVNISCPSSTIHHRPCVYKLRLYLPINWFLLLLFQPHINDNVCCLFNSYTCCSLSQHSTTTILLYSTQQWLQEAHLYNTQCISCQACQTILFINFWCIFSFDISSMSNWLSCVLTTDLIRVNTSCHVLLGDSSR